MKFKTLALASAAVVALSSGAFAKSHASANAQADAQEAAITQQLNQQQISAPGSTQTTLAANDNANNDNANTGTILPKDSTAPKTDLGKVTTATGNEIDQATMAKAPVTSAELQSAVSLNGISSETLKTAEVKNRAGDDLGEVNSVRVNGAGKVEAINAEVGGFLGVGERVVSLNANNLVYVKDRNLIVTNMTKDEIGKLPPVTN